MNSVANGKVYRRSPFKKMYIQSAAGDAGGAIGTAFYVWNKEGANPHPTPLSSSGEGVGKGAHSRFVMDHAFWGP